LLSIKAWGCEKDVCEKTSKRKVANTSDTLNLYFIFSGIKRLLIRILRIGRPNMIFFIHDYNTRNLLSRLDVLLRKSLSLHIGSDRVLGACF